MNKTNFKKYISYVKEKKKSNIEDQYIEKDYFISLFLSTWQELKSSGKVLNLDKLVFKGGTLLARNFLDYPRISEDLDFTYEGNNKYIMVRNSRAVYILNVYYRSMITGEEIPIKLELNFLEHHIHDCKEERINNIVHHDLTLKSIGYDLSNITLKTYPLDEIIIEKYRAILTRNALKERDVFDLYLIDKDCRDVFVFDNKLILEKIESGKLISPDLTNNLNKNCTLLHEGQFGDSDDDITRLSLVEINDEEYDRFKYRLYKKLKHICDIAGK